jgi:hypothetical protein
VGVASLIKIGFWHSECLKWKTGNKDFVTCLNEHDIFRVAESWARDEIFRNEEYKGFVKGNRRLAVFVVTREA